MGPFRLKVCRGVHFRSKEYIPTPKSDPRGGRLVADGVPQCGPQQRFGGCPFCPFSITSPKTKGKRRHTLHCRIGIPTISPPCPRQPYKIFLSRWYVQFRLGSGFLPSNCFVCVFPSFWTPLWHVVWMVRFSILPAREKGEERGSIIWEEDSTVVIRVHGPTLRHRTNETTISS
jgi:hypothetical protein